MKTIGMLLGALTLVSACSDADATGEGPDVEDGTLDDGVGGSGDDGSGDGEGATDDDCDPGVADCDDLCACDGSAFEDDCVEHQCASGCTEPQGYWKQTDVAWPVTELEIGGRMYDAPTLVDFLNLPTVGDASITLGTHLVAVKLNLAMGVVDAELTDEIEAADAWLLANDDGDGLPLGVNSGDDRAAEALTLATELSDFNSGVVGPGTCTTEEETP